MSIVAFRLPEPLAIVSIDGPNWQITMFGHGDCTALGVIEFAIAEQVVPYVVDMYQCGWRLIFGSGAAGIRNRLREDLA